MYNAIRYRIALWAKLWLYRRMAQLALFGPNDFDKVVAAGTVRGNLYVLTESKLLVFDPNRYGEKFSNAECRLEVERYLQR